jgi:hypothetical protein
MHLSHRERSVNPQRVGASSKAGSQIASPWAYFPDSAKIGTGKNLLIPGGFSFMIFYEIMRKEVILVYRSLWFTPLKS